MISPICKFKRKTLFAESVCQKLDVVANGGLHKTVPGWSALPDTAISRVELLVPTHCSEDVDGARLPEAPNVVILTDTSFAV